MLHKQPDPRQGAYVNHRTGGARGIYHGHGRTWVPNYIYGTVGWVMSELNFRTDQPPEELWAAYCAWRLTEGE